MNIETVLHAWASFIPLATLCRYVWHY